MRDQKNNVGAVSAIAPQALSNNASVVGSIIDTAGFNALTFLIHAGDLETDLGLDVTIHEGDDEALTDAAEVDATLLLGHADFIESGEVRRIGYVGHKRYVRITLGLTQDADGAVVSALAVLGHADTRPVA